MQPLQNRNNAAASPATLDSLPSDVVCFVHSFLSNREQICLWQVNKSFHILHNGEFYLKNIDGLFKSYLEKYQHSICYLESQDRSLKPQISDLKSQVDDFMGGVEKTLKATAIQYLKRLSERDEYICLSKEASCIFHLFKDFLLSNAIDLEDDAPFYLKNILNPWPTYIPPPQIFPKSNRERDDTWLKNKIQIDTWCKPQKKASFFDNDIKFCMKTPEFTKSFESLLKIDNNLFLEKTFFDFKTEMAKIKNDFNLGAPQFNLLLKEQDSTEESSTSSTRSDEESQ